MQVLHESNKNSYCLFFGHLTIEKLIKAIYAKKNKSAPYAPKTERQEDLLDIITKFNMNARYDDYKKEFYKKCTNEYTEEQIKNIEEVRKWLKDLLMMKQ